MAKHAAEIESYEDCIQFLDRRKSRKIASNTYVRLDASESAAHVRLYDTNILTYYAPGSSAQTKRLVRLDSGGYDTYTTKDRMNANLPMSVRVFQQDRAWFVCTGGWENGKTVPFHDGMTVVVNIYSDQRGEA